MISRLQKQLTKKILFATVLGTVGMNMWGADSVASAETLIVDSTVTGDQVAKKVDSSEEKLTGNAVIVTDTGKVTGDIHTVEITGKGSAEENKVTVSGSVDGNVAAVYANCGGRLFNNTVEILNGGHVSGKIYGAYTDHQNGEWNVETRYNNVIINGAEVKDVYGSYAYSKNGIVHATNNKVTITDSKTSNVYGGYTKNTLYIEQFASENTVSITGSTVEGDVYGGYVTRRRYDRLQTNNNKVMLNSTKVTGTVNGGNALIPEGNTLTVSGTSSAGAVKNFDKYTFVVGTDNTTTPVLTITGTRTTDVSDLNGNITVLGCAGAGTTVSLLKNDKGLTGDFDTVVAEGKSVVDDDAVYMVGKYTVEMSSDKKSLDYTANEFIVAGTYLDKNGEVKSANNGVLTLSNSVAATTIAGIYNKDSTHDSGNANGGVVNITGGTYDAVYGGYSNAAGSTTGNTVNLKGKGTVATLSGGNNNSDITGNTLNVDSYFTAGNIKNFETINFIDENFTDDFAKPTLTVDGADGWNLNDVKNISVDLNGKAKKGVYYLAKDDNGITNITDTKYTVQLNGKEASNNIVETAGYVKSFGDIKLGLADSSKKDTATIYNKSSEADGIDSIAVKIDTDTVLAGKITLDSGNGKSEGGVVLPDGTKSEAGDLVLDGKASADIIAGVYNKDGDAEKGNVIITGGTYDAVYGGYSDADAATTNNIVTLKGQGTVTTLSGGNKTATSNTLNIDSYFSAGNIKNFEKINFLDESFVDDYEKPTLTVTDTTGKWNLENVKEISVDMTGLSDDKLKKGVYYLATAKGGIEASAAPTYILKIDGNEIIRSTPNNIATGSIDPIVNKGYVKSVGEIKLGLANSSGKQTADIQPNSGNVVDSIAVGVSDETILAGSLTKDGNKDVSNGGVTLADVIKSEEGDLVLDGSTNADIIAGVYTDKTGIKEVKGTNVHILGGSYDNVYGAYSKNGAPTVTGTNVSWWNGSISDTLAVSGGSAVTGSGNSLTVYDGAAAKSVKALNGFDNYNFVLNNYSSVDKPVLSAKTLVAPARINLRLMLAIDANKAGAPDFKTGDKVTLLKTDDVLPDVEYDGIGNTCTYDTMATTQLFELKKDENNIFAKVVNTSVNKNSKALAEIKLGSSIAINDAINMTAGEGIKRATEAAETDANGEYAVFAGVSGGKTRNETGSYVDAKGTSFMVGFARRMDMNNGYMTNGMFVEYGTHSLESHVNDLISTGNSKYYGLGWLTKRVLNNNVYMEGSVHIGNVHSDYDGDNKGYALAHSSTSTYAGMHVGIGKTFKIGEDTSWDVYTKYFFSHVGAADYNIRGYDVNLGAVNTHRLALGTRWNKQLDDKTSFYVSAAVNKTFGGDQNGTIHGYTMDTPTISGCYGEFELGASIKTSKATAIDFGLKAYAGDRKGITANVGFTFSF